jgi:hypothetical protein
MPVVCIDCSHISDWPSFHDVFATQMGFPPLYGRNLDAWIDCMTSLDAPEDGMTSIHCTPPDMVTLSLDHADTLPADIYQTLLDCAASVNRRQMEAGKPPVLAIAAWRT